MKSKVFFTDFRTTEKKNIFKKLGKLANKAGIRDVIKKRDLVALKIHFGELGNTGFIRPIYLRKLVEVVKRYHGSPFLVDTNTLYAGARSDSPAHLKTAIQNGFAFSVVEAPIIIADGLRGRSEVAVEINGKRFKEVFIGSEIFHTDSLISVAHFKGHPMSGFGGALKNIGMGCASRRGKLAQHSSVTPTFHKSKCSGCGDCIPHCAPAAIILENKKAVMDPAVCVGCGECITICANGAVDIEWNQTIPVFMENMIEYAYGALKNKKGKTLFINFINNVSPACDCFSHSDASIVKDIGIAASIDPVALDQASVDLVNREPALPGTCLDPNIKPGDDKFRSIYPKVDWSIQLDYAQQLGLGNREYEFKRF